MCGTARSLLAPRSKVHHGVPALILTRKQGNISRANLEKHLSKCHAEGNNLRVGGGGGLLRTGGGDALLAVKGGLRPTTHKTGISCSIGESMVWGKHGLGLTSAPRD